MRFVVYDDQKRQVLTGDDLDERTARWIAENGYWNYVAIEIADGDWLTFGTFDELNVVRASAPAEHATEHGPEFLPAPMPAPVLPPTPLMAADIQIEEWGESDDH